MKAITEIGPWGPAIIHYGKDIENRTWSPSGFAIGERIAIHAGKKWDEDDEEWILSELGIKIQREHRITGAIIGTVEYQGVTYKSDSPWFFGPVGWKLANPIALPSPIPFRGQQGIWYVPLEIQHQMRAQLA